MADQVATKAAIEGLLKEFYLPTVREQVDYGRPIDQLLEKNRNDVDGLEAVMSLSIRPNTGVGYRGDDEILPESGRTTTKKTRVPLKYLYGSLKISGIAMKAAKSNKGSFIRSLTHEMQMLTKEFRRVSNFHNFGDGSGAICTVTNVPDANHIVVDRWTRLFVIGRKLDGFTSKTAGVQHMNKQPIVSTDKATKTLEITAHGLAVNDFIFLEGSRGNAQMGLMGIVDDGGFVPTFQGVSRGLYPEWKGKVMTAGAFRDITEEIIMDGMAAQREEDRMVDLICGTSFQMNDLAKAMQSDRRFVNPRKKLSGGIMAVDINGVPFTFDPDCPPGYCFMLDRSNVQFYINGKIDWMQDDGNVLSRVRGKDGYEATLYMYRELGADVCASHVRIEMLNENRPVGL